MPSPLKEDPYLVPGGMNDSVPESNLSPETNQAPVVYNFEFDQKGAAKKRRGGRRLLALAEVANPTVAPTLERI